MKKSFALIALALSLSAFSQEEVQLNSKKVYVNSAEAILVRTNQTPETVEVTFQVPMANSICIRQAYTQVYAYSGFECGYYTGSRVVYYGRGLRRYETYSYPRQCLITQAYCAEYASSTRTEPDTMKLKFKNLAALGDSESETFRVIANQKRPDSDGVLYNITPVKTVVPYKVEKKKVLGLFNTTYVVELQ